MPISKINVKYIFFLFLFYASLHFFLLLFVLQCHFLSISVATTVSPEAFEWARNKFVIIGFLSKHKNFSFPHTRPICLSITVHEYPVSYHREREIYSFYFFIFFSALSPSFLCLFIFSSTMQRVIHRISIVFDWKYRERKKGQSTINCLSPTIGWPGWLLSVAHLALMSLCWSLSYTNTNRFALLGWARNSLSIEHKLEYPIGDGMCATPIDLRLINWNNLLAVTSRSLPRCGDTISIGWYHMCNVYVVHNGIKVCFPFGNQIRHIGALLSLCLMSSNCACAGKM